MSTRTRPHPTALVAVVLLAGGLLLHSCSNDASAGASLAWHPFGDEASGLGRSDGYLDGREVSVHDLSEPAVARLDPALRAALARATDDADRAGVTLRINSGWRSAAYQRVLLHEAEKEYGSATEAGRWVRTPQTSTHVTGAAVDVGPDGAATWLARHGSRYDLCRTYANEPWHFELRTTQDGRCPPPSADSSS